MQTKKQEAIQLRKLGKSYNEITKRLGIPKSTLSTWLKGIKMSPMVEQKILNNAQKIWAKSITDYNKKRASLIEDKWQKFEKKISKEINKLSAEKIKLIGTVLYWAEGYKKTRWTAMFCNSDPDMVHLMMKFLREICLIPEEKLKPQIQIHVNISEKTAKRYWSQISNLPIEQFRKTLRQTSRNSKNIRAKNTLPYGVFRIYISDVELVHKLKGWIKGLIERSEN